MDFARILQSFEELLYEVMSWLVFYPRALWRVLRNPVAVARYTKQQLHQERPCQFREMMSPPLMLILSIIIAYGIHLSVVGNDAEFANTLDKFLFGNDQARLAARCITFSIYSIVGALAMLRVQGERTDRETLREPFYIHCYLVTPFALVASLGLTLAHENAEKLNATDAVGAMLGAGAAWYVFAQVAVYRRMLGLRWWRAILLAFGTFTAATLLTVTILILVGIAAGQVTYYPQAPTPSNAPG
jgi:hypothetical protein